MRELLSFLLIWGAAQASDAPRIDWFDPGHAHAEESYLVIDSCFVPIKTKYIKDFCYIQARIKTVCQIEQALGEKCE